MKKAKTFLIALVVVAIVGAGLAFKAQTFGTNYCVSTAYGICGISPLLGYKVGGIHALYYHATNAPVWCFLDFNCTASAFLTRE